MENPFKGDREKLKKMTFPQKVDYIWTYYRFWIVVIIISALVIGGFVQAQLAYNPDAMTMLLCDTYSEDTGTSYAALNEDFRKYMELGDDEKDPIEFDDTISFSAKASDNTAGVMLQKLMALVMSGGADLMIAPESAIVYYGAQEMFGHLEDILPEDLFNMLKEQDLLFETTYVPTEEERAEGAVEETFYCGIRLEELGYFQEKGIQLEDMAGGLIISGKHQDLAIDFLYMIFDMERPEA